MTSRRRPGLLALLVPSGLAACTSLLGVDGAYEAAPGEGGGGGSPVAGPITASTLTGSGGEGAGGEGVGGEGVGGPPAGAGGTSAGGGGSGGEGGGPVELPSCSELPQIMPLRGRKSDADVPRYSLHGGDGAVRLRARVVAARVSIAFDEPGGLQRALVYREPTDPTVRQPLETFEDTRWATPFAADPWLAAGQDASSRTLRLFGADEVVDAETSVDRYDRLRDAWPYLDGARFIALHETDGWQIAESATREGTLVLTTLPITCTTGGVIGAALIEHTQADSEVIAACNDGEIAVQPPGEVLVESPLDGLRAIAGVRNAGGTAIVARAGAGIFLLRASPQGPAYDRTFLDAVAPYSDVMPDERRNRVAIATGPNGDVFVAWTRGEAGSEDLAAARCSMEGPCCALRLDVALDAASVNGLDPSAPELVAATRREPALASSFDGDDLALGYLSSPPGGDGFTDVIGVRLVFSR